MALEDLTGSNKFISNLVPVNPADGDDIREGAAHLRGTKNVLINTFPNVNGAVTATDEQLNSVADKVGRAGDTMTGALRFQLPQALVQFLRESDSAAVWDINVDGAGALYIFNRALGATALNIAADGAWNVYGPLDVGGNIEAAGQITGADVYAVGNPAVSSTWVRSYIEGAEPRIQFSAGATGYWILRQTSAHRFEWLRDGVVVVRFGADGAAEFNGTIRALAVGGGGRTNSGFIHTQTGFDVGQAPGMARGQAFTDASGLAVINWGFNIVDPVVTTSPEYSGAPAIVVMNSRSQTGITLQGLVWNGSQWIPTAGVLIHWQAIAFTPNPV